MYLETTGNIALLVSVFLSPIVFFAITNLLRFAKPLLAVLNPFRHPILAKAKFGQPSVGGESDQEFRHRLFHQDFDEEKIPKNVDVIVIGSGISSLSTAVMLARAGKEVVVLEQHSSAGGCMGMLKLHGQEYNIGLHLLFHYGVTEYVKARDIFGEITAWAVKWADLPGDVLVVDSTPSRPNEMVTFGGNTREEFLKHLTSQFPEEKAAIQQLMSTGDSVWWRFRVAVILAKVLPVWLVGILAKVGFMDWITDLDYWRDTSLVDYLKSLTDNVELQKAIYAPLLYLMPANAKGFPAIAMQWMQHKMDIGFSYPIGGPEEVTFQILRQIHSQGGQVMVNAAVQSIITDQSSKKVTGVRVIRKNRQPGVEELKSSEETIDISAPIVVSGVGVWNTFKNLLPSKVVAKYPLMKTALNNNSSPSSSAPFASFVSLQGTAEELGLDGRDRVFMPSNLDEMEKRWLIPLETFQEDSVKGTERLLKQDPLHGFPQAICSFPSSRDPSYNSRHPGRSTCCIFAGIPRSWFSKWEKITEADEEHNDLEKRIGKKLLDLFLDYYPQLKSKVQAVTHYSPARFNSMLSPYQGKLMGLELDANRFTVESLAAVRPKTGLKGLFITGQDLLGPGTQSAAFSGIWTASEILERHLFLEMELRARVPGWLRKILRF